MFSPAITFWRARGLHWLKELTLIVVSGLLVSLLLHRLLLYSRAEQAETLQIGSKVSIPGIDLRRSTRTVVLVESPNCQYCMDGIPFHRRLADLVARWQFPLVLLMPEASNREEREGFLGALGIQNASVITTDLRKFGIAGTPTIFVADMSGTVIGLWVGQLLPEHEEAMLARLQNPTTDILMEPEEGTTALRAVGKFECCDADRVLLDIRPREAFRAGHRNGAINIPIRELQVRAPIECSRTKEVVVDCTLASTAECGLAAKILQFEKFSRVVLLNPWTRSVSCKIKRAVD